MVAALHPLPKLKLKMEHSRPLAIEILPLFALFSFQADIILVRGADSSFLFSSFATSQTFPPPNCLRQMSAEFESFP